MPEIFCVDPSRDPYKASVGVRALSETVWFDDGHQRAKKGELFKLSKFDAVALSECGHVELIDG
jgi:hypothetical protein